MKLHLLTILCLAAGQGPVLAAQPESDERHFRWAGQPRADAVQFLPAQAAGDRPVQLAQNYDFDVYIDQYGREIIVDAATGEVVEIRPPVAGARRPAAPRSRPREFDGQVYDFTDPREVDRYRRDRSNGRDRNAARADDPYSRRFLDDVPVYEDPGPYREPPVQGREPIQRAPLEAPSRQNEMASVPPQDGVRQDDGLGGPAQRSTLPGESAVVAPTGASEEVANFQVLLDRMGASPGVIDGRTGDNVNKAIRAYREITGETIKTYDPEWIKAELERTGGPAFQDYVITSADAAGPFIASVPADYSQKAQLEALSYTSVTEMLAERFHMDEKYLIALNPGVNFNRAGSVIRVVNPGDRLKAQVAHIVADKSAKQVRAYGEDGRLIAAYPATIGSADTPSPSGSHTVARIAVNPEYTYNPKINFKQGQNDKVLRIPPGPNGPVGSVWIALSKPTYGIHGTPDPSKIGKTASHGCIRLTNWDAEELAKRVKTGVPIEFAE
ncbi:L,D-transpeptidase [Nitratireductor pacificus]|uniref:ErfK/YbiS/YcfS/YnhG protein n=1 Tax=Nitratireductor pacificus pht-3B TaxID=391937 RepID=K2LID8_9HYPH|nr:L,D-transpeptidase [Nitratireductor pacificus]EKF17514.1 ErfK/YbiS/YcfS/YnhG protein [Nitratireductor pacificus pht-3B]